MPVSGGETWIQTRPAGLSANAAQTPPPVGTVLHSAPILQEMRSNMTVLFADRPTNYGNSGSCGEQI
jgi:hypothetical protein